MRCEINFRLLSSFEKQFLCKYKYIWNILKGWNISGKWNKKMFPMRLILSCKNLNELTLSFQTNIKWGISGGRRYEG